MQRVEEEDREWGLVGRVSLNILYKVYRYDLLQPSL